MGRSIYRELPSSARDALIRVAEEQRRTPDQQAAKFVLDGLQRAGVLTGDRNSPSTADPRGTGTAA